MNVKMFSVSAAPAALVLVGLFATAAAQPAHAQKDGVSRVTVTIDGSRQGQFGGPAGEIPVLKYDYNVVSPRDVGSGQATGKRQYSPIVFQKLWDKATVQINRALLTGENLRHVTFTFYDTDKKGGLEVAYKVILSNAAFVAIHQHVGDTLHDDTLNPQRLEDVSLVFQGIVIQDQNSSSSDSSNTNAVRKPAAHGAPSRKTIAAAATPTVKKPLVVARKARRVAVSAL